MNKVTYLVPGISCGHCVNTIENELLELEGVILVATDLAGKKVTIEFQDPATEKEIRDLLVEIEYPAKIR